MKDRDEEIIDSSLLQISGSKTNPETIHFVYAGWYYWLHKEKLSSLVLKGMKKYKINSVTLTMFFMQRQKLITKEIMESYCKGKENERDTINDDLDSLFENMKLGKRQHERVYTYFLPKLTEEEMKLVERKDPTYLESFYHGDSADVTEAEMELSESNSKYVEGQCFRRTFTLHFNQILTEFPYDLQ